MALARPAHAITLLLVTALLAGCVGGADDTPPGATGPVGESVAWRTLDGGAFSGVEDARTAVAGDAAAWADLWEEYAEGRGPPPHVNFSSERVVGVFLGEQASPCHVVDVADVTQGADGALVVHVLAGSRDPDAECPPVPAYPYVVVSVPAGDGDVVVDEQPFTSPE